MSELARDCMYGLENIPVTNSTIALIMTCIDFANMAHDAKQGILVGGNTISHAIKSRYFWGSSFCLQQDGLHFN